MRMRKAPAKLLMNNDIETQHANSRLSQTYTDLCSALHAQEEKVAALQVRVNILETAHMDSTGRDMTQHGVHAGAGEGIVDVGGGGAQNFARNDRQRN